MKNGLLFTGNDHPAHKWEETTPMIKEILEADSATSITVSTEKVDLENLDGYDFLVLNYANWKDSSGISQREKQGILDFLEKGGGLLIMHFANGAFHFSLPDAGASDWPEYRNIVHQVWDSHGGSKHDKYGSFEVVITDGEHFITKGLENFVTDDELYYKQVGEEELPPLFTALSKDTGNPEPMAWAYTYKNARVFQSLLGHGKESYAPEPYQEILRRAVDWVCELE